MKRIIAALALTAAIATPALAAGYRQAGAITPSPGYAYDETSQGKPYRDPSSVANGNLRAAGGYDAYAYAPDVTGSVPLGATAPIVWHNGSYAGADPDPTVRTQLQIQADVMNR